MRNPRTLFSILEQSSNAFLLSVCAARKGEREDMQDRHLLIDSLQSQMESLLDPLGVYGHVINKLIHVLDLYFQQRTFCVLCTF